MVRNPLGIPSLNFGFAPQQGKKHRPIDKNVRDAVWLTYMGNVAEGKCYCCNVRSIHLTDFQVGHNKAVAKNGSDDVSNLRPICRPCNGGMGTMSIERYRQKYFGTLTPKTPKKETTPKPKSAPKRKAPTGEYVINLFTGKREKAKPLFKF